MVFFADGLNLLQDDTTTAGKIGRERTGFLDVGSQ